MIEKNLLSVKDLVLVPEKTDQVSSAKPYFALIYFILNEFKRERSVAEDFKGQIEKLWEIADENGEEKDYLISEIQELTGEDLDEYFLKLFKLAEWANRSFFTVDDHAHYYQDWIVLLAVLEAQELKSYFSIVRRFSFSCA